MSDGSLMTGEKHGKDSKPLVVIDDKPKKKKAIKFKIKSKKEEKKEEPKKEKKNVPFVPKPKVDYKKQVIDKYDLKIGSRIRLGDSQGDEVAIVKELGDNKMKVETEIGNVILTLRYNRVEIEKMIKKKMKDKKVKDKKEK